MKNNLDGLYHTTGAQNGEIWLAEPEPNLRSKNRFNYKYEIVRICPANLCRMLMQGLPQSIHSNKVPECIVMICWGLQVFTHSPKTFPLL